MYYVVARSLWPGRRGTHEAALEHQLLVALSRRAGEKSRHPGWGRSGAPTQNQEIHRISFLIFKNKGVYLSLEVRMR